MANLFLKSFENSQLNIDFKNNPSGYSNLAYIKRTGAPPRVVKIMETPFDRPLSDAAGIANQTMSARIPRVGKLLGTLIQWTGTASASLAATIPIGLTIAGSTVFNSGSYPLYRQSAAAAHCSKQSSFVSRACNLHNLALPLSPLTFVPTAGTTFTTFCNIHASFFEDEENLYDAQNNVQATIDCTINNVSGMGIPDASFLTALSGKIFTFHVLYDAETENLLLATNRPKSSIMMQLGVDSSYRSVACPAAATAKITINNNACLRQLAFRVRDTLTANRTIDGSKAFQVYSFSTNNEFLHYRVPRVVGAFLGNQKGFSAGIICSGVAGTSSIDYSGQGWTILPFGFDIMNRTQSSGMLALKNLDNVEIEVDVGTGGTNFATSDVIEYTTEEWVMYEFDVYSGEVSIAVAS